MDNNKINTLKYAKIRLLKYKIKLLEELIAEVERADYSTLSEVEYKREYGKARTNYHYISKKRDSSKELRVKY